MTTDSARPIIRWGVVGTGTIARAFVEDLRLLPDAELGAVVSRSPDRARAFLNEFGGDRGRIHTSVDELAGNAEVDVVYVATPHTRHKDDCLACLEGGRAVLCEKPFTVDAIEARSVVEHARKTRRFCMEAMWMRFHPLVLKVRELVQSGKLGEIRLLTADFGYPTSFDSESRFFNPALGGGALLDRGVYPLSLAYFLLGSPAQVLGQATIGATAVDEQETTLLSYSSGALALLAASLRSRLRNEALIIGTEGRIRIHEPFYAPRRITWTRTREPVGPAPSSSSRPGGWKSRIKRNPLFRRAVDQLRGPMLGVIRRDSTTMTEYVAGQGYQFEAAEVMRCLRAGELESPLMPLNESVAILESVDALRRSWNS